MQRKQFGRRLCEFQGLQWKFAEMKMKLDAGQLLLYRAASNADNGFPSPDETAIAKAYCNQAGFEIERLIEIQAPADAETHDRYAYVTAEWARKWPCEEIWAARKR